MFAALNTVESPIVEREMAIELERDKPWYEARLPSIDERVRDRLRRLADCLGDADWLVGSFSPADLLMIEVLLRLEGALLNEFRPLRPTSPEDRHGRRSSGRLPPSAKSSNKHRIGGALVLTRANPSLDRASRLRWVLGHLGRLLWWRIGKRYFAVIPQRDRPQPTS
jgi:hypothetical protein